MKLAFILVVIIVLIFIMRDYTMVSNNLRGTWMASHDFCDKAGIVSLIMIVESVSPFGLSANLLVVTEEAADILPVKLSWFTLLQPKMRVSVTAECEIWPDSLTFEYELKDGRILIRSDDMIYADVYRDNTILPD